MLFGIVAAPVTPVLAACAPAAATMECHSCCADSSQTCCTASAVPHPAPAAPASQSDDGKQLAAPHLVFLYVSPASVAELPAVLRSQSIRVPAQPLFARHCVFLI
jgi:hypothetical protein